MIGPERSGDIHAQKRRISIRVDNLGTSVAPGRPGGAAALQLGLSAKGSPAYTICSPAAEIFRWMPLLFFTGLSV